MSNYVNIEIFEQIKQKFFEYIKQDENVYWNISKFPLQLSYRLLLRYLIVYILLLLLYCNRMIIYLLVP